MEDLSDSDLERLVEKLSRDVQEKQVELKSLKTQIQEMQDDIKIQQKERAEFAKQLFKAEEVTPLVEQCVQLRQNVSQKSKDFEAMSQGTSDTHGEIRRLESQLCETESGLHLLEMEKENQRTATSLQELKELHKAKVKEQRETEEKLAQTRARVQRLKREQAERRPVSSQRSANMDAKLDRFIRKTCKQSGLHLH